MVINRVNNEFRNRDIAGLHAGIAGPARIGLDDRIGQSVVNVTPGEIYGADYGFSGDGGYDVMDLSGLNSIDGPWER